MVATPRARVLVLREKQRELLPECKRLHTEYWDRDENDSDAALIWLSEEIKRSFGIDLSNDDLAEVCLSPEEIAGALAIAVLNKAPPNTKPPWGSPWQRD